MTKVLSKIAPIAGAAIGLASGGGIPAAALGLGLGGAAGGVLDSLNPPSQSSGLAGINPAAYQPLTPDQLNQYLGLLYPDAPPQSGGQAQPLAAPATAAPAAPAVIASGRPGSENNWNLPRLGATLQNDQEFVAGLAAKGVDVNAPDFYLNPEWQARQAANFEAEAPIRAAQQRQYEEQGFVGPSDWMGAPPPAGGAAGIGGAPSISAPQISGGTPAYNIAGGALSKTNTVVQNEFARRFPEQLAALDELRAQVAPNVSLARQAALGQVRDQARQAQGNLRQQISRRGLAGSSFAQSAEGQLSAEYAKQAAQVEVQAAQQELDLTTKFIDMQRGLMAEALTRDLNELQIGADLAIAGGRLAADIANIQATLAAAELQARTQLNVANITSEASRFASTSGVLSQGIASEASRFGAEIGARGGIIQAGLGANASALENQVRSQLGNRDISSQEAAGRASYFGNLAGLGLQTFFNSGNNTGGFINTGASTSGFPFLTPGLGFS